MILTRNRSPRLRSRTLFLAALATVFLGMSRAGADDDFDLNAFLGKLGEYAEKLEEFATAKTDASGLEVRAAIVPDAYRHAVLRDAAGLLEAGYSEDRMWKELGKLHRKHRRLEGRALVRIELEAKEDTFVFLQAPARKTVDLKQERGVTFSVAEEDPTPRFQRWQIFEYRPNVPRRSFKRPLSRVTKARWSLTTNKLDLESEDPIELTLNYLLRQEDGESFRKGVNVTLRQIGCTNWDKLAYGPLEAKFYPAKWQPPEPPEGLRFFLEKIRS